MIDEKAARKAWSNILPAFRDQARALLERYEADKARNIEQSSEAIKLLKESHEYIGGDWRIRRDKLLTE